MQHRRSSLIPALSVLLAACGSSASSPAAPSSSGAERPSAVASTDTTSRESARWPSTANPRARYLVAVGIPTDRVGRLSAANLESARLHAARSLQSIDGVEVAPARFDRAALGESSSRRNLGGFVLECAVVRHAVDARGTHVGVQLVVVDLRTVNVLATLTGGATAPGPAGSEAEQLALQGALDSAFRGLPSLLASLGARRGELALSE